MEQRTGVCSEVGGRMEGREAAGGLSLRIGSGVTGDCGEPW